jgi:hypothetical protein
LDTEESEKGDKDDGALSVMNKRVANSFEAYGNSKDGYKKY